MVEAQLKEKTVTSNPFELKKNKVEEALEDILEDRKAAFNKTNEENIKERQEKAITKLRKKKRYIYIYIYIGRNYFKRRGTMSHRQKI